jgi:hypothetical protein
MNRQLFEQIGGGGQDYQQSAAQLMQSAQSAMGSQRPVREEEEVGIGGALQAGMGGALSVAGTGAAIGAVAGEGTAAAAMAAGMTGPVGLAIGAGVGLLSAIFG